MKNDKTIRQDDARITSRASRFFTFSTDNHRTGRAENRSLAFRMGPAGGHFNIIATGASLRCRFRGDATQRPLSRSFTARCGDGCRLNTRARSAAADRRRHWPSYRKWMRRGHFPPTIAAASVRNRHVFPLPTSPPPPVAKRTKALILSSSPLAFLPDRSFSLVFVAFFFLSYVASPSVTK